MKPFSLDGEGAAINLHNIASDRQIQNVPVKGQCARNYFYGKNDLRAERLMTRLEGQYSRIVALLSGGGVLSDEDKNWLRMFIVIQQRRTEFAIEQMRDFGVILADTIYARAPDKKPEDTRTDSQLMHESLSTAMQFIRYAKDLKVSVFRNRTAIDFITSDNPAVITSRFHFQKMQRNEFGISSSGVILSMPASPKLSLICYDGGVYSLPNASGTQFIDVTRVEDVNAINQLQYLAAAKNIYFMRWEDAARIGVESNAVSEQRAQAVPTPKVYVRDDKAKHTAGSTIYMRGKTGHLEKFRKGTIDEELTAKESLVAMGFPHPKPTSWPSQLRFRASPKTFYNGSGIGHVRKKEWLRKRP